MPDSQPNYLITDDTGDVSAQFSGGVDLVEGAGVWPTNISGDPDKSIRWRRNSDGALTAYVSNVFDSTVQPRHTTAMTARDPSSGNTATIAASALVGGNQVVQTHGTNLFMQKLIIDSLNNSSFLDKDSVFVNFGLGITGMNFTFKRVINYIRGFFWCSGYANGNAPHQNTILCNLSGYGQVGYGYQFMNFNGVHTMMMGHIAATIGLPPGTYTLSIGFTASSFDGNDVFGAVFLGTY